MNEYVKLETRDDHILLVTLNRPDKRNAINSEMIDTLETVMRRLHEETYASIGCVVISGAGGNFSAGRDLKDLEAAAGESLADRRKRYHRLKSFADSFEQCPVPVIAAVEGYALGLAAGIVTWCDMAVMGEQAKFGYPEAKKRRSARLQLHGTQEAGTEKNQLRAAHCRKNPDRPGGGTPVSGQPGRPR